jgi:hypothetical protein
MGIFRGSQSEEEKKVEAPIANERRDEEGIGAIDSDEEEDSEHVGVTGAGSKQQASKKRFRSKLNNQKIEKLAKDLRSVSTYAIPGKET